MKRDIYQKLHEWKQSVRRKPLVLNGARQVGKTYALKHFGRAEYRNTVYLNFEKDEKIGRYFEETLDPEKLLKTLSIHTETEIEPERTLLIFDEVQECPKALNSLK
jgi:predicted AAA+ superfamily ATPase